MPSSAIRAVSTLAVLLTAVPALCCCGDDESQDPTWGEYSYWVDTMRYDPLTDRVSVVGLYKPSKELEGCLLPWSQVRHEFTLGDEGWVAFTDATPITEELWYWVAQVVEGPIRRIEIDIPGRGLLTTQSHPLQSAIADALLIDCTTVGFVPDDQSGYRRMDLRCGYCVEHGCGNGICDPGESWYSCHWDCLPPVTVCGDGTCDGTEYENCRSDCGCTNANCHEECVNSLGNLDYGYCGATDTTRWSGCGCGWYTIPCDGSEPFCNTNDFLGDEVVICEQMEGFQARRGCNQLCYEAYGTGGGYCDVGGTEDCVCQDGLSPW